MRSSDTTYQQVLIELITTKAVFKTFGAFDYYQSDDFIFDIPIEHRDGTKTILLRHDIDHSTSWACDMARVEAELGVCSTYFFLTTDLQRGHWKNADTRKRNIELLLEIQDLGHEVGLHYDVLGEYFMHDVPPKVSIEEALSALRAAGLNIHGCVAHGSGQVRKLLPLDKPLPVEYINYTCWKEIKPHRRSLQLNYKTLMLPALDLEAFDLRYEAYFVRMDSYLSDNHGRLWSGGKITEHTRHSPMLLDWEFEAVNTASQGVTDLSGGGIAQILTHPIHWHSNLASKTSIDLR